MFLFINRNRNRTKEESEEHQNEIDEKVLNQILDNREKEKKKILSKHEKLNYLELSTPLREYIILSNYVESLVFHPIFSNYILMATVIAGIIVGVQTYPAYDNNEVVLMIDSIVLYSFSLEVIMKLVAEGKTPQDYFIGAEWRWNWFDFLIVLFSLPFFPVGGGEVKLLRLVRLMRLAKVFRKVPQLQMIMMGLIGGLKSIVYIVLLLLITFYLFAIAGIIFFRDNDPWHFKSVEIAMLTLLRIATLDDWGNILYINYFGCEDYPADYYTNNPDEVSNVLGSLMYCSNPQAKPYISAIYFIAFIVICTFCILSLFIGAVSMSMSESMEVMKLEKEVGRVVKEKLRMGEVEKEYSNKDKLDRKTQRKIKILELAFSGQELFDQEIVHVIDWSNIFSIYKSMSIKCQDLAEFHKFQNFITITIVLAGVTVGMNTDRKISEKYFDEIEILDAFIQYIFLSELLIKVCAEGAKPYKYFHDNWNIFDFIVVVGSFLPTGSGNLVTILRLMRLLRVLKLMRALPQLQVIVSALMKGMGSIGFISVILFMFFFLSGVVAMTLFQENDPVNFGTLHMTILILFLSSTLDNWSNFLYTNLYGCAQFGYDDYPGKCDPNAPFSFFWTSIFWVIFILIGGLVLLTLFIGVVTMGMEDAKKEQIEEDRIFKKAENVGTLENMTSESMKLYKEVFDVVDFTSSNKIGRDEMHFGLKIAGIFLSHQDFMELWQKVDDDGSNALDFSEFLEFMFDLRNQIKSLENGTVCNFHDGGGIPESFAISVKKRKDTLLGIQTPFLFKGIDSENSSVEEIKQHMREVREDKESLNRINTSISLLLNVPMPEKNVVSNVKLKINESIEKLANDIIGKESLVLPIGTGKKSEHWGLDEQEVTSDSHIEKMKILEKTFINSESKSNEASEVFVSTALEQYNQFKESRRVSFLSKQIRDQLEIKVKRSIFDDIKNIFFPKKSRIKYLDFGANITNENTIPSIQLTNKPVAIENKSFEISSQIDNQIPRLTVSNVSILNNQMKNLENSSPISNNTFVDLKRPVTAPASNANIISPSFSHNYNYNNNEEVQVNSHILSSKYDEEYKRQIIEDYKLSLQQQQPRPFTAPMSSMSSMSGDENVNMNMSLGGIPIKMVTSSMFAPQQQQFNNSPMVMIMVPQEYLQNNAVPSPSVPNFNNGQQNNYNTAFIKNSNQFSNRGSLESFDSMPKSAFNNSNHFQDYYNYNNYNNSSDINHLAPFNTKTLRSPSKGKGITPNKTCKSLVCSI